jgi:Fic family protein
MTNGATTRSGRFIITTTSGEHVRIFVPHALPPRPPLNLEPLQGLIAGASESVGRLDGMVSIMPDAPLFLYMYVRKEALLSSQIEGTQSSLSDLLRFETTDASGPVMDDVREVSNYVDAITYGLERITGGFPLSLRLIREMHQRLLASGRGNTKNPGEFRRSQNWIGGSRPGNAIFVPPPPEEMTECMNSFEIFLHEAPPNMPVLVKAGLIHQQFESIHPFLDGNGRMGRLLVTLLLCAEGVLREPLLYLSLYLKTHRDRYYALLQEVREKGNWEDWLEFFLVGVQETADQATRAAREILNLFENDRMLITEHRKAVGTTMRAHAYLQSKPFVSAGELARALEISHPTAISALERLEQIGIVREITGQQYRRIYAYDKYMNILSEGTEPLPE